MSDIQHSERKFDPIGMEIFSNRLQTITEEMGNNLIRSAFSTNIKERRDCSVGLFDARGRLVAQASHIPLHLGSLKGGVEAVLAAVDIARMLPGDAYMCNDPYLAGGTHMPDISIVTPVFHDGQVRFFTANIAHHSDIGGSVPGSISGGARSVFEEGLRIPVIRIVRGGELDADLLNLLANNTREPEERMLDLKVQIATNQRGAVAVEQLIAQMGLANVENMIEDVLDYTARRLRNRVRELKSGSYAFTSHLDEDGSGTGDPVPIAVTVTVDGERLKLDFTGSGVQARGALNVPRSALEATVYYAVKALLDPQLMPNHGMFAAIEIFAPEGTITNPRFPAAVGARSITCQKIAGAIFGAFRGVLPKEKVLASGNDLLPGIVFSGRQKRRDGTYVYMETVGGGSGAGFVRDGMDAVQVHVTNSSNLPVEALENEYPLRIVEYALVQDSGGAGRQRGGLGIAREVMALEDGTVFTARSDSHLFGPAGAFGGKDGGRARLIRNPGTPNEAALPSKTSNLVLKAGETVRIETPGGAGYGPPEDRSPALLAADLRGGKVSRSAAQRDYGPDKLAMALGSGTEATAANK
ncbi:MAG TPA: hydantoinase B/oxoprolinase family protein [Noviherbaspirillum sp.]|nr:hydantoinase B/oxoprolinase family protein [Noviherbaspirillum sp.]